MQSKISKLLIVTQTVDERDQLLGFFTDWISGFADKFEQVSVVCLNKGMFSLPQNVKVIGLGKSEGVSRLGRLWNFYKLIFALNRRYDAVFVHMNPIWAVLGGIPWIVMGKRIFLWYTHKSVTWKLRAAEIIVHKIFTASAESFRLGSSKVSVTGHGINTDLFKPDLQKRKNGFWILSVGRIAPVKNYGILVEAAKILKQRHFEFNISMVGEPALDTDREYMKELTEKINEYGLRDNFHFAGKVVHVGLSEWYQSHHLFVHLSKTGSLDKVMLEAMACGMTVLSSNDAAKNILPDGLIFDGNNPDNLAGKIISEFGRAVVPDLREIVIRKHGLAELIGKISSDISAASD